jgi:ADP-ribose pyrophosphatase YjhB (NUDIX family)
LGYAQLLFIQRWDNKLQLPKGQMQAGETEEQAAERIALQEAGVGGIQLQTPAALGELQCKDKPVKEDKKVVTVIKETIRVLLASPSEQFVTESRENVTHVWISLDDLPKFIAGSFVGASRLHASIYWIYKKNQKKTLWSSL